jgi:hypothetical protein
MQFSGRFQIDLCSSIGPFNAEAENDQNFLQKLSGTKYFKSLLLKKIDQKQALIFFIE